MKSELLGIDASQWASFLADTRHDFYHLPGYVSLCAAQEGGEPAALMVSEGGRALLLPLIIRPIPGGASDATSPYGYPGPLASGGDDPDFMRRALGHGIDLLRTTGVTSLFVRMHPLLGSSPPAGIGTALRGGDTVSVDLTLPTEELWRQTTSGHRNQINRALKSGREPRFDDAWVHFDDFKRLYRGTMRRVAADSFYFFDDGYFDRLRTALGDRLRLCVVHADGGVAAAALFVETCGIVQFHLAGSDPSFAREGLTKLMLHFVRSWAKDRGDLVLHLGGGLGDAEDPLLKFKAGFSPLRHPYHTIRVIIDEGEYDRLVRRRAAALRVQLRPGYFPAYRAPAVSEG